MSTQIKLRRDTYANWTSINPVLAEGEIGLVTNFADNNTRIKIGDGVTAWEDLDYFTTSQDLSGYVTDAELATALSSYVTNSDLSTTLSGKQDSLVSGTNIKTINGNTLLGSGDISVSTLIGYTPVTDTRTLTINGTTLDLSANRSWTVGDVTTGSAASLASLSITGTAGNGFVSLINQSSNPSAVNGTIRLFSNASSNLTWVRRNNANSADIRRTLIFPDQDLDVTMPTPATGSSSTLAGLSTAQTFTEVNRFSNTSGTEIYSIKIWKPATSAYVNAIDATGDQLRISGFGANPYGVLISTGISVVGFVDAQLGLASSTGTLTIGTNTSNINISSQNLFGIRAKTSFYIVTGNNTGAGSGFNTQNISYITGSITNASASASSTGSHLFDVGTASGTATAGGISFFNGFSGFNATEPNWQGMQRGIFVGNATAVPTANPSGGYFNYSESGNPIFRTSGGSIIKLTSTTGWGLPTGTLTRTTFDTTTVTLPQLAERVAALINDLRQVNGLLSA